METNRTERFLDLYRELEQTAIGVYGFPTDGTAISRLEKLPYFSEQRAGLKYCREVRALLSHNPKVEEEYAVEPGEGMLHLLEELLEALRRPASCGEIAAKHASLLSASETDFVLPLLRTMTAKGYSHIPVLRGDGTVQCVFSETVLTNYLLGKNPILNERTQIRHIVRGLDVEAQSARYRFLASSAPIMEAEELFSARFRKNQRIRMLLLTEHGNKSEPLVGFLTPWDILGV